MSGGNIVALNESKVLLLRNVGEYHNQNKFKISVDSRGISYKEV